jgi:hypothetical protein
MDKMPTPPQGPSPIRRRAQLPPELEEVAKVLARMENPVEWFGANPEKVEQLVRAAILAYSGNHDPRVAEILPAVYMAFMDLASLTTRRRLFIDTWQQVARGAVDPAVLWAIAMYEEHPLLVAMAIECYVSFHSIADYQASDIAPNILEVFEESGEQTRSGIFQGLMVLGEAEVFDLLRMYRWELTDDEVSTVCSLPLGDSDATVYLFLLDWLEEAQAANDHARSRAIASALTVNVEEIERSAADAKAGDYEVTGPPSLFRSSEPFANVPIREFARYIEPRLRALAEQETGRPVMPAVLEGWGLACSEGAD